MSAPEISNAALIAIGLGLLVAVAMAGWTDGWRFALITLGAVLSGLLLLTGATFFLGWVATVPWYGLGCY